MKTVHDFDQYSNDLRMWCSGGHRLFNIMPDGVVTRCVAMYYVNQRPYGNITDDSFFDKVIRKKDAYSPCERGYCIEVCDSCYSEQGIIHDGKVIEHAGCDVIAMSSMDYCILQIHLTGKCNYSCDYCCADWWMKKMKKSDISVESWVHAAEKFTSSFETGSINLMGGEPTVAKAFVPLASAFLKAKWKIQLVTNFSLPDRVEAVCKDMSFECTRLMRIQVSLHVTHKGFDLDKIISELKRLRDKYGVQFAATIVETKENMEVCKRDSIREKMMDAGSMWFTVLPNRP